MTEFGDQIFGSPTGILIGDQRLHKTQLEPSILVGGRRATLRWFAKAILSAIDERFPPSGDGEDGMVIFNVAPDGHREKEIEAARLRHEDRILAQAAEITRRRSGGFV